MRRVVVTGLGSGDAAGRRRRDQLEEHPGVEERRRADHPVRRERPEMPHRLRGEAGRPRIWLRPRTSGSITRPSGRSTSSSSTGSTPPARRSRTPASPTWTRRRGFAPACSIGSGIGGLPGIESESLVLHEKGPGRVSPHFVHGRLINLISGQVSIKYGLMGPNHAVVTACSTGAHSIGDAARMIQDDDADIMLAGGAEATICPIGIAGFAQARALSTNFNDQPEKASRPYDKDRDGFVMGEGAGVVVLEEYEHAKARGAKIYAEVVGYGLSGRRLSRHRAASGRLGRVPVDGDGAAQVGAAAVRHRLYQRARHFDAARRRARARRGAAAVRQCHRQRVDEFDQVGDRAPARRRRRGREHLLHPCDARPDRPADAQPRQSRRGRPRASTWSRTRRRSGRSARCSTTASASAAPTPASS